MIQDIAVFNRLQNANVAVIHDDVGERYWWLLRSLPAISYLDFATFTYPTMWRTLNTGGQFQSYTDQYSWLDYDYKVLAQLEEEAFKGDLVVITNEYYESETQYPIDHLVSRYASRSDTLVIVSDSARFTPQGGQRPLYQEQFVERLGSYQDLYRAYESVYDEAGWDLPLLDTKNLFLHDNANLYEFVTGNGLEKAKDLFERLPEAPYLPLYHAFGAIFARKDEFGSVPLDSDDVVGLQRWLRRRVEWDRNTATEIAKQLNEAVSTDGKTFDPSYVGRSPEVHEARREADRIDPDDSSIHKRYHASLQWSNP